MLSLYCPEDKHPEEWDINGLKDALFREFGLTTNIETTDIEELYQRLYEEIRRLYENKEKEIGSETLRYIEKMILLQVVDSQWKDHLLNMDHLKEGIGLRGYGQRDPLVEYKKEAFEAFSELSGRIESEVVSRLFKIQIAREDSVRKKMTLRPTRLRYNRGDGGEEKPKPVVRTKKIGRNDPCICGSGKKYKKCCGMMSYAK
jgi:preprotein translocase subunit SecA